VGIGSVKMGGQTGVVVGVLDNRGVGLSALWNPMRCLIRAGKHCCVCKQAHTTQELIVVLVGGVGSLPSRRSNVGGFLLAADSGKVVGSTRPLSGLASGVSCASRAVRQFSESLMVVSTVLSRVESLSARVVPFLVRSSLSVTNESSIHWNKRFVT
jgi:hypothetical protein